MTHTNQNEATEMAAVPANETKAQSQGSSAAAKQAAESLTRQANKGILADHIGELLNVPRKTSNQVLDAVLDSMVELLRTRGKIAIKGFGTFERRIRKGRAYKHPLTGVNVEVPDREMIMFKPSDQLNDSTKTGAEAQPRRDHSQGLEGLETN